MRTKGQQNVKANGA